MSNLKLQNLYIRACKSKNPQLRLFSLYKRFYVSDIKYHKHYVKNNRALNVQVTNLLEIIQRFELRDLITMHNDIVERIDLIGMIKNTEIKESNNFANEYITCMLISCINVIRFTAISDFEIYYTPKFKKRLKENDF